MNSARAWGGNEKWVYLASTALGRENSVYLTYRHDSVGERFSIPKLRLPFRHEADLETIIKLISFVREKKIDILIPSKRKDYVLAGIVSRFCGVASVLRLGIARRLDIPLLHRLIYDVLNDGIIVNAKKIKDVLLQAPFMRAEKIRVIYNGLDTDAIERQRCPAAEKPFAFTVTALGGLTHLKGFDFLIRSFARFLDREPGADAGLVIIGDGASRREFGALAENLGIGDRVVFTGFLKNPYPHLASSDVFAMTSINEGISNALLEAMYLKNAPVSTRAGGSEETVTDGKNGLLVDYGDEHALAEAFDRLYNNPGLTEQLADRAAQTVTEMFSMDRMTREILSFCKERQTRRHPV